jgi:regulatory protein
MARITRLVAANGRTKRVRVYLDGKYSFTVEAALALESGLAIDKELDSSRIAELEHANTLKKALGVANLLLSFRPRSEQELKQKLLRKGYDTAMVAETMQYLKERRLVNDADFARFWAENRSAFSPRSARMVQLELRQKGVAADVAEETSDEVNDASAAYLAGVKKAARLEISDYEEFRRRVGEYLRRRGFGYDVIDRSVKRLWEENAHKE